MGIIRRKKGSKKWRQTSHNKATGKYERQRERTEARKKRNVAASSNGRTPAR